jgi:CheY-like chemotaxis protein
MKGDEGSVLVVDDNEVNRDLLARRLQRQGRAVSVAEDGFQVNPLLRSTRIGACLAKKRIQDRPPAYLQQFTEEQEKSESLLGKEETNG